MKFSERVEIEKKYGRCCNSCLHFNQETDMEPCFGCTGTIKFKESGFSKWESCRDKKDINDQINGA